MLRRLENLKAASDIADAMKEFINSDAAEERCLGQYIVGTLITGAKGLKERNSILATTLNVYFAENLAAHKNFDPEDPKALIDEIITDTLQAAEKQLRGVSQEPQTIEYAIDTHEEHYADPECVLDPVFDSVLDDYEGCGECSGCAERQRLMDELKDSMGML